jgi:hypothetical protein
MSFEWGVRAEFATQHLIHEQGIQMNLPLEMYLGLGYDLQLENPKKWNAIQEAYALDIARVLKNGMTNRKGFRYRELP